MDDMRNASLRFSGGPIAPEDGRLGADDILKILPHRDPFLFVDKVTELEPGKRIEGVRKIRQDEYFFKGHFPSRPIMPGVLMIEALAQAAGILSFSVKENAGRSTYFIGVDNVRFRKAVIPGDELRLEVEFVKTKKRLAFLHGTAKLGEEMAAEADLIFGFRD